MSTTISGDTGVDKATNQAVKDAIGVTGTAPIFGCCAWVNFDGTRNEADTGASVIGQNVKIRASGNVSSVVKNGVGSYTVNFTTAMPDANYSATGTISLLDSASTVDSYTTSSVRIVSFLSDTNQYTDPEYVTVSIFR